MYKDDGRKVLIRTFSSNDAEKIDKTVNDFRDVVEIIAVQTHINITDLGIMVYTYVVFYKKIK